jgi:hypoxanthine phosphoribosyltransferase
MKYKNPDAYKPGDIIIPSEEIDKRLDELSMHLVKQYKGKKVLLVGLLTGAAWLTVDLLSRMHRQNVADAQLTFMKVSRYRNGVAATYEPRIEYDMVINPQAREILLVDDIADTGKTLAAIISLLKNKGAQKVRSLVLVDKPSRREITFQPDYRGFEIPNVWVQGRGMDSDGFGRGDPDIRKGPYFY